MKLLNIKIIDVHQIQEMLTAAMQRIEISDRIEMKSLTAEKCSLLPWAQACSSAPLRPPVRPMIQAELQSPHAGHRTMRPRRETPPRRPPGAH